ncbi:class I SAM-dependent methyltransferase [Flavitalea sp. BT771]|uniref:class I SAM-dependent methyltransferase n=1 Tax=Flavitalea sp. BT771 TaxID=3063329 RepID=UPI0026E19268|nr:class I SAM-dependent methyltransferase [Flavitalea sp. BT771]MDO6431253.1 class I SAM-dependent methyltransferase [Flavitalea sp. BT771]MDV6220161.1 class I SAM-dependent methyltransferase [Flavitalea sp. BT771]
MQPEKLQMFRNRLTKTFRHTSRLAGRQSVSCYRIYDHDLPEFPFCIELYEDKVYLAEYRRRHGMTEEEHEAWLESCLPVISEILGIPDETIYWRQRQRKAGRQGQYEKLASEQEFFVVKEAGLSFRVNLTDYLDTGLFLDHRITRGMVREASKDKKMLNLFCYTGSFSVYAAAGGAVQVDSVDLSKTYLGWAEENMALNKPGSGQGPVCNFIHADVKQWLDEAPAGFYDLVVMDPPTFSNSKRMKDFLDIQRDHPELLNKTLHAMKPGGLLFFSTNSRKFQLEAEKIAASSIKDITNATTPFDFQGKLFRWCYKITK